MHYEKEINCKRCKKKFIRTNIGYRFCCDMCRFMSKLGNTDSCWIWKGTKASGGYGYFSIKGKNVPAHRAAFMLFKGPISKEMQACHICDNPICVNPDHIFIGTIGDNARDRNEKGRSGKKGEKHHMAKLTNEKVLEIHEMKAKDMKGKEIAKHFGVCEGTISMVLSKKRWPHLNVKG